MITAVRDRAIAYLKTRALNTASVQVLIGDQKGETALRLLGAIWQVIRCDPQTFALRGDPSNFHHRLRELGASTVQEEVIANIHSHLAANAEHIAPLPVLLTVLRTPSHILVQSRDLGKGLGEYMDYIGGPFSTRPEERRRKFYLEDQGNGIFLVLNQSLNGCLGKAILESSGQKVTLEKVGKQIYGRRIAGSRLRGTSISLLLPLAEDWIQESSGWDPHDLPPPLRITWVT